MAISRSQNKNDDFSLIVSLLVIFTHLKLGVTAVGQKAKGSKIIIQYNSVLNVSDNILYLF